MSIYRSFMLAAALLASVAGAQNWPQFRGAQASGVSEGAALPSKFDLASGEGVKWRARVPGLGLSSPVIWGDKLFVTTAVSASDSGALRTGLYGDIASVADESEHVWKALAYDKRSGKLLWERELSRGAPAVKRHMKSSHASATAATDGERLVVFFGSEGLHCLDLDGKVLWSKSFGVLDAGYYQVPEAQWEFGNSPVIHDGKAVVLADVQKGAFLGVYSLEDGKELWRVERDDVPTWGAPLVVSTGERTQIVVNGWKHAGGYDFETGEELWRVNGGGDIPVPSPVYGGGRFYLTNAHGPMSPVYAVSEERRGETNLTAGAADGLAWVADRKGAYMATPLLLDGLLYVVRWNGILVCFDAETGKVVYEERLPPGAYTASPVGGDGKLYVANEEGDVLTIQSGPEFEILARTTAEDPILATPAISDGVIFFRTGRELIAVGR
jgi:outer membrane protein assembly factor BamB